MFATFFIEREPLRLENIPAGLSLWAQEVGGFAMVGLVLWLIFGLPRLRPADRARIPSWQVNVFSLALIASALSYALYAALRFPEWLRAFAEYRKNPAAPTPLLPETTFQNLCLTLGGACAIFAVLFPILVNFGSGRFRRIFALAKLSFKEAIRSRVLYCFLGLLLVFLFASWFVPYKPEDQVRTYVQMVYLAMSVLLLFSAAALGGFSLPTDIRNQTIHTIVTKPVERFEVVAGRFLGFTALMTVVLLTISLLSLVYVLRGVDPDAAAESLKARQAVYGDLSFENTHGGGSRGGDSVGREWDYRGYISGPSPPSPPMTAIWSFASLPSSLGNRQQVRCEITFDIFRTTKGEENKGVSCGFYFYTPNFVPGNDQRFREARKSARSQPQPSSEVEIDNKLSEELGYYEVPSKEITDYHTVVLDLPGGLFRADARAAANKSAPPLQVKVRCNSYTQYVGMANYDLYFRLDDPGSGTESMWFAVNFIKGTFGLWLRLCLIIGLAVALSTYMSGVISFLVACLVFLGGYAREFIQKVGEGTNTGGGPSESLLRLVTRSNIVVPLEETTPVRFVTTVDVGVRWVIRRVLDVLPDVDRFDLTAYVAEGFNIGPDQLLIGFLLMVGYLLPWAVLAYYLMKWREIAAPT